MYLISNIDTFCRTNNIKFIYGMCLGLAGYIFVDFGSYHVITDENGQEILLAPGQTIVEAIPTYGGIEY